MLDLRTSTLKCRYGHGKMWGNAPPIRIKIAKRERDAQGFFLIYVNMDMVMDMELVASE